MVNKVNLLIAGASGGVANALLHHMVAYRGLFNKLILLDKNKRVLNDPFIDHKALRYQFIHKKLVLPAREKELIDILKRHEIDILLDITDMESFGLLRAADKAGVTCLNTGMNDESRTTDDLIFEAIRRRDEFRGAPHILCSGMNPGNVNMFVRHGIEKFGVPQEVVHFEFDTSRCAKHWHPIMTWSIREFLEEVVKDPGGIVTGRGKSRSLYPNALENRVNMRRILAPIMKRPDYPEGCLVMHEECASIGWKYDIPSKFVYAVHPKTTAAMIKLYEKSGKVKHSDLKQADNTEEILDGADSIGVYLEYPDKRVYYFNSVSNLGVIGTNATYTQVIVGIFAALFTLLYDPLEPGCYFVEDLYDQHYKYYLFDNLRVQEFIFNKDRRGKLTPKRYDPMVRIRRSGRFEHLYVI